MSNWIDICKKEELSPNVGVCALVGDEQVAVFFSAKNDAVYAISNYDPFGEANVLSRGIIGSIGEQLVVASPLYKQHFNLETGVCLEDEGKSIKAYEVRVEQDRVQIRA